MSAENLAEALETEELVWGAIRMADPDWAEGHLVEFQGLNLDYSAFWQDEILSRKRAMHYEMLQAQGKVPDFFGLRNQARVNLGPATESIEE